MFGSSEKKTREEQDIKHREEALQRLSPEELLEEASRRIAEAQVMESDSVVARTGAHIIGSLYSGAGALEGLANAKLMQEVLRGQQEQAGQLGRITLGGM